MLLFADDLKLVVNVNLYEIAQNDLDILNEWQKKWLLSFNTTDNKCKVLPLSRRGRCVFNKYYLNDTALPIVDNEKYLGVKVANNLKCDQHIKEIITNAKKCIGWVTRNVISREPDVMLNIYKLFVGKILSFVFNYGALHQNMETGQ